MDDRILEPIIENRLSVLVRYPSIIQEVAARNHAMPSERNSASESDGTKFIDAALCTSDIKNISDRTAGRSPVNMGNSEELCHLMFDCVVEGIYRYRGAP